MNDHDKDPHDEATEALHDLFTALSEARAERDRLRWEMAMAIKSLEECRGEIDQYIRNEYPHDHPVQERYRKRDFAANPARVFLVARAALQVKPNG